MRVDYNFSLPCKLLTWVRRERAHHTRLLSLYGDEQHHRSAELEREGDACTHAYQHPRDDARSFALALGGCIISYWIIDRVWVSVISEFHLPALNEQARKAFNQVEPPIHNTSMKWSWGARVLLFLDDDRTYIAPHANEKISNGHIYLFCTSFDTD